MDRFFITLSSIVLFTLIYASATMFQQKAAAVTYKKGFDLYFNADQAFRKPAVMPNNK